MAPRTATEERSTCAHDARDARPIVGKPNDRYCEGCMKTIPLSAVGKRKKVKIHRPTLD